MIRLPLSILVLADSRSFHTERYVRELRRQGCRVLLASLERGPELHLHLRRIGPFPRLHYLLAAAQVRKVVRRFAPHVINAHFATGYGWLVGRSGCAATAPVVLHLWGSDILQVPYKSPFHRRKARRALAFADLTIGDSQHLLDQAALIHPLNRSEVKYWGIERQYLALADTERPPADPLRIVVPRHHEPVYNHLLVLRALEQCLKEKKVTLTVPAFGSRCDEFKSQARSLPPDAIRYYDRLPRDQFMSLLSRHDVYLSASQSDSSPASLIEAMGLGLIPVAADIPGVREWLTPESGYLFEPGNPGGLRKAIEAVMNAKDSLVFMRTNNYERVKREAIFENAIADTISLMASLAETRK